MKQYGGHIGVYSELGAGTVFRVYLPRVEETQVTKPAGKVQPPRGGTETIMVVEDDERLRTAIIRMLAPQGYRLLVTRSSQDAIDLAVRHGERIDLVLSDVIMPGLNGPEVVGQLRARCDVRRVLFISGYTDHALLRTTDLDLGVNFLQKPFAPDVLVRKVRDVLDARDG